MNEINIGNKIGDRIMDTESIENKNTEKMSEIDLQCAYCQENVQLTEIDADWFAYNIDKRGTTLKQYLDIAISAILGKDGKCTKSEDGKHLWFFGDKTNKLFTDITTSVSNEEEKMSILDNKKKQHVDKITKADEDIIKLEEEKRKLEKIKDNESTELINVKENITKSEQATQETYDTISRYMRVKNVGNFKQIWLLHKKDKQEKQDIEK